MLWGFNTQLIIMISNSLQAEIKLGFLDGQTTGYILPHHPAPILSQTRFEYKLIKNSRILNAELERTEAGSWRRAWVRC